MNYSRLSLIVGIILSVTAQSAWSAGGNQSDPLPSVEASPTPPPAPVASSSSSSSSHAESYETTMKPKASYDDFVKLDIRSGTITKVEENKKARIPAYKIWADFGPIGIRQTSAQVTINYSPKDLIGRQIVGVLNLGSRKIAGFDSQFLMVGFPDETGAVVVVTPNSQVPNGKNLF